MICAHGKNCRKQSPCDRGRLANLLFVPSFVGVPSWQGIPRCCNRGRGSRVEERTSKESGTGRWHIREFLCVPLTLPSYRGDHLWREGKSICRIPVLQCHGSHEVRPSWKCLQPLPGACWDSLLVVWSIHSWELKVSGVWVIEHTGSINWKVERLYCFEVGMRIHIVKMITLIDMYIKKAMHLLEE